MIQMNSHRHFGRAGRAKHHGTEKRKRRIRQTYLSDLQNHRRIRLLRGTDGSQHHLKIPDTEGTDSTAAWGCRGEKLAHFAKRHDLTLFVG